MDTAAHSDAKPCSTCRWHNDESKHCGLIDSPASTQRRDFAICGPSGVMHHARPTLPRWIACMHPAHSQDWAEHFVMIAGAAVVAAAVFGPVVIDGMLDALALLGLLP